MRTFRCDSCGGLLFFENDTCLACGQHVGFRPDTLAMCTVASASAASAPQCRNWTEYSTCNWFAPANNGGQGYCAACMLNEVVPNLAEPHRRELWIETERAKRRLIFTLLELRLAFTRSRGKAGFTFSAARRRAGRHRGGRSTRRQVRLHRARQRSAHLEYHRGRRFAPRSDAQASQRAVSHDARTPAA